MKPFSSSQEKHWRLQVEAEYKWMKKNKAYGKVTGRFW